MQHHETRRNKLRRKIRKAGADALLVTNFTNVTYLTGFTGDDSYLLVTRQGAVILSDPRYTTQLEEECPDVDLEVRRQGTPMIKSVQKAIRQTRTVRVGVEAESLSLALYESIRDALRKCELVACHGLVEQLRQIKDRHELKDLRAAIVQAERAFTTIRTTLRAGMTELEVAHNLEHEARRRGARGCSFPPIVAAGSRSALPHAYPTCRTIETGGLLLIDWGATGAGGYRSDLTRVLVTGKISPKLERIYRVVLKAQEKAIAAIRPGVPGCDVDRVARTVIHRAGFGRYFGHGLGHGLGLDIHEGPRLAANDSEPLRPGMVVTVEPGIYLPGIGGVRLEDDVLVTREGHDVLTHVPKRWDDALERL